MLSGSALLLALALVLSGSALRGAPFAYADGGGPLGPLAAGTVSLLPPTTDASRWSATFGSMLLCRLGGDQVTLQDVRPNWAGAPVPTDIVIRSASVVSPAPHAQTPHNAPYPTGSLRGDPTKLPGTFAAPEGYAVTQPCEPEARDFSEILVTMHAGPAGASIRSLTVDYLIDGRPARTTVPSSFTACGTAIDEPDICPSAAHM